MTDKGQRMAALRTGIYSFCNIALPRKNVIPAYGQVEGKLRRGSIWITILSEYDFCTSNVVISL
jgi:hypothetical protein